MMGSTVLSILLWALAAAFVLDYGIGMDRLERGIVLVALAGVAVWTIRRFLVPALLVRESDAALAVLVDTAQGLHSNLVAAIEFDDDRRRQYGSEQLREVVVDQTGRSASGLNFLEGFSAGARRDLTRRLTICVVTAAVCLVPGVLYSDHTGAFLRRLVLGEARYPTRTSIESVAVDSSGKTVAEGSSVTFVVRGGGVLPASGEVRVEGIASGAEATIELVADSAVAGLYTGTLDRVLESLSYTVHLGDAYPVTRKLTVVPLPRVDLDMQVVVPKYARGKVPPRSDNQRHVIVPEGSAVIPVITASKPIASGTLTIEKDNRTFTLTRRGDALVLDDPNGPLARIDEMVRFGIRLTDTDGLSPENPVRGLVYVSADLVPRVGVVAYSRRVVPTASPELRYRAVDDYGLDHITLHVAVSDVDGKQTTLPPQVIARINGKHAGWEGAYRLNLKNLNVQKGCQVSVAVEAVDHRGEFAGKARRSEKWVFEVSDRQGVAEAMDRLTEQMDRKLDEILRAQLEAGK